MTGRFANELSFPHVNGPLIDLRTYGPQYAKMPSLTTSSVGVPGHMSGQGSPEAPWFLYFGQNAAYNDKNAYDAYGREINNLPEAYKGENIFLSQMLITRIPLSQQWFITEALPFRKHETSLKIDFDIWRFDDFMLSRTPEQAPSRLLTSNYDSKTETMTRYGIGLMLEHGFMKTERGRASYRAQLLQIVNATVETLCFGACMAILYVDNNRWRDKTLSGFDKRADYEAAINRELNTTFIIQKHESGWKVLRTEMEKAFQERNNQSANYFIVGPGVMDHIAQRQEENYYYIKGPNSGTESAERRAKQGITVREFRGFHVGPKEPNRNPALRIMICSKFARLDMSRLSWCDPADWKTRYMDREIHNERSDQYYTLEYMKLLPLSGLFDQGAPQIGGDNFDGRRGDLFGAQYSSAFGGKDVGASRKPFRYTLSPTGMEFYSGYTHWGQYMEDKGLRNAWIKSFLLKDKAVQAAFLEDVADIRQPAMSAKAYSRFSRNFDKGLLPADYVLLEKFAETVSKQKQELKEKESKQQKKKRSPLPGNVKSFYRTIMDDVVNPFGKKAETVLYNFLKDIPEGFQGLVTADDLTNLIAEVKSESPEMDSLAYGVRLALGVFQNMVNKAPRSSVVGENKDGGQPIVYKVPFYGFGVDRLVLDVPSDSSLVNNDLFHDQSDNKTFQSAMYYITAGDGAQAAASAVRANSAKRLVGEVRRHWLQMGYSDPSFISILPGMATGGVKNLTGADINRLQTKQNELLSEQPAQGDDDDGDMIDEKHLMGRYATAEQKRTQSAGPIPAIPLSLQKSLKTLYTDRPGGAEAVNGIYAKHVRAAAGAASDFKDPSEFEMVMRAVQQAYLAIYNGENVARDGKENRLTERQREKALDLLFAEFYFGTLVDLPARIRYKFETEHDFNLKDSLKETMKQLLVLDRHLNEKTLDILHGLKKGSLNLFLASQKGSPSAMEDRAEQLESKQDKPEEPSLSRDLQYADVARLLDALDIQNADIVFFSAKNDIYPPLVHLYVIAPSVTYQTSPTVLMAAYGAAGFTFHGHHSMELADHAIRKVHVGHFTLYAKAVIMYEDLLEHRYHTFCHQYLAGGDCTFWNPLDDRDMQEFRNGNLYKDRMVWAVHPDETSNERRITLTGYEHPSIATPHADPMFSSFPIYAALYQIAAPENPLVQNPFREQTPQIPCLSFEEHQVYQAGPKGQKGHVLNAGHWGIDDGYEGCGRVRSGGSQFLEKPNWSETSMRTMTVSSRAA